MANQARLALAATVVVVVAALAGLTYVWWSAQFPGGGPTGNPSVTLAPIRELANYPIALAFAPASDGRVFYAERRTGNIQILGNATREETTFYTLTGTNSGGERGLLGLALDPGFPTEPYVYAYQTYDDAENGTLYNRIVRILVDGDIGVSHEVLLELPTPGGRMIHNGGVIAFGPDGMLYAVVGDQGADPGVAQDGASPLGKVLRMYPNGSAPPDNPFLGNLGWHPLVYTYGHRNMFGLTFHPTTGQAYVTENGPAGDDEVNRLVAGGNYGWPEVRGIANMPPYIDPLVDYSPAIAPTNAAFYGAAVPAGSRGHLVFGAFLDQRLHELTLDGDGGIVLNQSVLATAPDHIIDVEMGVDGFLWVTTPAAIYRLVPAESAPSQAIAISAMAWPAAMPVRILVSPFEGIRVPSWIHR